MDKTPIPEQVLPELLHRFHDEKVSNPSQKIFKACKETGTQLWLDTGDIEAIDKLITPEVTAQTTNNTLLNKEVQKGIYDGIIKEMAHRFDEFPPQKRLVEMAFLLNALHASRLVKRYGGMVSVELHTDLTHDVDGIVHYGQRFHKIDPKHFLIKVPLSPSGLIGARKLHEMSIPVNFTLLFSVRQNMLATLLARPAYTNVFMGRIGAYMQNNHLGEAKGPGEKTVHHAQKCLKTLRNDYNLNTKLIAASIREYTQLPALCGVDVMTIPAKVVSDAIEHLKGPYQPMTDHDFNIVYEPGVATSEIRMDKLWSVSENEKRVFKALGENLPESAWELVDHLREEGITDIFPHLTPIEELFIADDGKVPRHDRWASIISRGETAIDTLLNLAGMAAFTKDQKELDERIKSLTKN
ncbi:transaldolase family protein [Marinilabilia rubra]|uniref:Transaldolase n=1 Tax=Marinilabilia rubra TaxID=2162893 RepID=A0A2U2B3B3_9BACT|nr:transaldolase family protein [Marinilabilia rubra]PWD97544.1 transaldolase [Marinilabilia rubra]